MPRISMNAVAREVCELEGGKVNLPIAQVKEVIRCYSEVIMDYDLYDIVMMLNRYGGIYGLETRAKKKRFKTFLNDNYIY